MIREVSKTVNSKVRHGLAFSNHEKRPYMSGEYGNSIIISNINKTYLVINGFNLSGLQIV
jgi:hypothetical protein